MRTEEEIRCAYQEALKEYERIKLIDQFYTEKVAQQCNILGWVLNDKEEK